ncbi:MAG: glycosyltransferase family 4 protein [Candidatus Moranbacteria bacterium]|nr:glycosyltransferase family 4 protein [Candidatus Moranbacteria bacterium]
MKLLIFSPYYPPHIGGLETHADEFNKHLSAKNVSITVFTTRLPAGSPERETMHGRVTILRFPAFEIIPNYPLPKFWQSGFWKLFLPLFNEKFDLVISRTRFFNASILALLYAKTKRTKWIHIEHGSDFVQLSNKFNSSVAKIYDWTLGRLVLKLSDKNIANSAASAGFCKRLSRRDCAVIYRGVEIEKIDGLPPTTEIREKYPNRTIITFLGRLIDGKGVADLIQAVAELEGNYLLFIIGDGPQKRNLEKLAEKLGISDKIIFWGHKNQAEAVGLLKISDIFVNPSYTEGLPTSVIEAALCEKAIIATNVGGTPEIITDSESGYLIDPKNTDLLKGRLELLLDNPDLRENFGKKARRAVYEKFNWDRSIGKYLEIFKKIIS